MKGVFLEAELMRSDAFRSLSRWAMQTYLHFLTKRVMATHKAKQGRNQQRVIVNNGEITFSYSEAEKIGIGRREFRNSIDELIDRGFLDITHQGAGGRAKDFTLYHLADRWRKWGQPDFQPTKKPRSKDTRQGRGWALVNSRKRKSPVTNTSPKKPVSGNGSVTPNEIKQTFRMADMTPENEADFASSY